jgi:site-specific DNA-methyltransferase (adenine-specific)
LEFSKSVWTFPPESAKKVGHPAPFPVELPYRCIQLFTFKDEVILDPFCGVGTSAIASIRTRRHYICLDNDSDYVEKANKRVNEYLTKVYG